MADWVSYLSTNGMFMSSIKYTSLQKQTVAVSAEHDSVNRHTDSEVGELFQSVGSQALAHV